AERKRVLNGESMRDSIYKMITDIVESSVDTVIGEENNADNWNLAELNEILLPTVPLKKINRGRKTWRCNHRHQHGWPWY
ncbi:MAG: hypothetical protein J6M44_08575, partial [Butyrivibrio sp.]|nr:hypothetical protein [Butyrivibrio sp.]